MYKIRYDEKLIIKLYKKMKKEKSHENKVCTRYTAHYLR